MQYLNSLATILFIFSLGWYLITNLQWYNYSLQRIITKHHKRQWHIIYFAVPIALFYALDKNYFNVYLVIYVSSLLLWHKKLDKPLVLTKRVVRFLSVLLFITTAISILCTFKQNCHFTILVPLIITLAITSSLEKIFFLSFKHKANKRLKSIPNLKIIAITASYGKTSIKNYLHKVLSKEYNVYMTPRSVNTIGGIVKDINNDLPLNTQIYIVEAGARQKGDIEEIALFLQHQYAIIGSIGEQHIEYFKTLDNIIYTKMEVLKSSNLLYGVVHNSVPILNYDNIEQFPKELTILENDLDGIKFSVMINNKIEIFDSTILGAFNAINLTSVILIGLKLGIGIDTIRKTIKNIPQTQHRLQKIVSNGKIIIDDSFNGNLDGMLEAVKICKTYKKKKIIITPGLVESTTKANIILAKAIDNTFDLVILTSDLNRTVLTNNIINTKIIHLKDKTKMQDILLEETKANDLILFANDAPNFI